MIRRRIIKLRSYLEFCILSFLIAVPSSFAGKLYTPPIQQDAKAGEQVRCLVSNTTDNNLKVEVTMYNNVGTSMVQQTVPISPFSTANVFAPTSTWFNNNAFCEATFKGKKEKARLAICVAPSATTNCDRYIVGN